MSNPETPRRADTIVEVILEAADRIRQEGIQKDAEAVAAKKSERKAVQRAERYQMIAKEAIQRGKEDPLTDCWDRRYFEKFSQESFDPTNDDGNVGLVFVDIDDLKLENDTFGHVAGDKMIKTMAELLKTGARKSGDTVVRLGGDEFLIISKKAPQRTSVEPKFDNTGDGISFEDSLKIMMERITRDGQETYPRLLFSYGIAVYDKVVDQEAPKNPHMSVEVENIGDTSLLAHTLMRADAKMYAHKAEKDTE